MVEAIDYKQAINIFKSIKPNTEITGIKKL